MSSHHFVREGQEPSLLVEANQPIEHPFFEQLAGWNPIIIATEKSLPGLISASVNIDHVLLSDMSLVGDPGALSRIPHVRVHEIENTTLAAAINQILEHVACKHVQIVTDHHSDFGRWEDIGRGLGMTVFTPTHIWKCISSGNYRAWFPKGQRLDFQGNIRIDNSAGLTDFITVKDGIVEITSDDVFWVGERNC